MVTEQIGTMFDDMSSRPAFILVHGTFARRTRWVAPGGRLALELHSRFPGAHVEAVHWSGANLFSARERAAETIRERVSALGSSNLYTGVYVIAHSHGGSAAIYALRNSDVGTRVGGLVTMGTPFMCMDLRGGYATLAQALLMACAVFLLHALVFGSGYAVDRLFRSESLWPLIPILGITSAGMLAMTRIWSRQTHERLRTAIYAWRREVRLRDTMQLPVGSYLLLRTVGDEVSLGLGAMQLVARLSSLVSDILVRLIEAVIALVANRWRMPWWRLLLLTMVAVFATTIGIAGAVAGEFGMSWDSWGDTVNPLATTWRVNDAYGPIEIPWRVLLAGIVVLVFLATLAAATLVATAFFAAALATVTGGLFGIWTWRSVFLEFSVEQVPLGDNLITQLPWEERLDGRLERATLVRHSAPYADPRTVAAVERFVRKEHARARSAVR